MCEHPCRLTLTRFYSQMYYFQKDILCSLSDVSYNFSQSHEHTLKGVIECDCRYRMVVLYRMVVAHAHYPISRYPMVVAHIAHAPLCDTVDSGIQSLAKADRSLRFRLCLSMRDVRDYHPVEDYHPVATVTTAIRCAPLANTLSHGLFLQ